MSNTVKLIEPGFMDYDDPVHYLDKPVNITAKFIQDLAKTNFTKLDNEHNKSNLLGDFTNFRIKEDGALYADVPEGIDYKGKGFSPRFKGDLVNMGDHYEAINGKMDSVALTESPRNKIFYNSIIENEDNINDNNNEGDNTMGNSEDYARIISEKDTEIGVLRTKNQDLEKYKTDYNTLKSDYDTLVTEKADLEQKLSDKEKEVESFKDKASKYDETIEESKVAYIKEKLGDDITEERLEVLKKNDMETLEALFKDSVPERTPDSPPEGGSDTNNDGSDGGDDDAPTFKNREEYQKHTADMGNSPTNIST